MAQRYDIVKIDFQANARGANAAIEALRKSAEDCNDRVTKLKKDLADGIKMGKSTEEIENIHKSIAAAQKEARSFKKGYDELAKGMRTLDTAIKAFNDGSLAQMNQAFQKAANNAARLTRTKLDPLSDTYKEDYRQLTALMDATQQNFARMQGDAQQMVKTLKDGGKVSVSALQEEIKAQQELLSVLAQTDKGYQQTEKRLAVMQHYLREMGGDYEFVRQNITDTKKVSDDMLRNMYAELQKTNQEGKVTRDIIKENAAAMKEIRTEQARRVENVLGGNLGQQSEQSIRAAIANAKELLVTYKSNSKEAQTLSAQIVNAEEHLRTHGLELARTNARNAAATKTQEEAEKQLQATMNKRLQSLKTLSADALAETRKYWEAQRNGAEQGTVAYKKAEDALRRIDNLQKSRRVGELDNILGDPKKHGIAEVRNAVQEMEKLRDSVQQGIPAWQHYNKMVEQGKAYLDNLAKSEAAQRINQQMQQLSTLSASGLQEVKRYWETMVAGAAHGSTELDQYRAKLEQVMAEEKARSAAQAQQRVGILGGNLGEYGEAEIRQAIEAGKELIQTYKTADPAAQQLAKNIVAAEEHLKQYGVEAERAAQREAEALRKAAQQRAEADQLMMQQLQQGTALSQSALRAQEQYWQRLIDDPKTASASLDQYKANLEAVKQLQTSMALSQGRDQADKLLGGDFDSMTEGELRAAITAAREYQQTLSTVESKYHDISKAILDAEEYVKKYGIEAERAARKEASAQEEAEKKLNDRIDTMVDHFNNYRNSMSDSALKAHERFWQQLIDDPKTAAESLETYRGNLEIVQDQIRENAENKVRTEGESALNFFRGDTSNASADQIKQQADAMKKYRDSLPQKDNAAVIAEIDGYLQQVAATTQKATEQTMTWKQAMQVSAQAGTGSFKGTTEQLNQAKKTLEDMSDKAMKGGLAWRRMQEALQRIELELKNVGQLSAEVQAVLDQPKGKSFNALKQAVEQGRLALNAMDRSTKEGQKAFDELAAKIKAADFELKQLGNSSKGTASAFDKAWSRLKTYVDLYVGAAVAMQKLTAAMGDLMELSDKMGEVRKTTGFTADEVGRLSENLAKLDTRTTLTQLMELSSLAGSVGLKTQEQVQGFTEAADQLIVALPELGNESARTIIKIANATGDLEKNNNNVRETLEKVGSTIIALRANSASAAGPITDFVSRVGAVGAQAGISIDQIAALGSTIDALGGRVEMSATALSRMIPAIKNNSFAIANSIGVTEKYLKSLAPMEQMVLIFQKMRDNIQHIDTSTEEGQEQMAQTIEGMLGRNATMREVMKDLEQQGARAGIVFGLLSQNVDELQKQLGIASEAYRENTALANEFNNMNETAAAKWERLKNQVEEMFVGDSAQRFLGGIIDGLRWIVDLLAGKLHPALNLVGIGIKSLIVAIAVAKTGFGSAFSAMLDWVLNLRTNITKLTASLKAFYAANKANIWTAAIAAAIYALKALYDWYQRLDQAVHALAEAEANLSTTTREAGMLFSQFSRLTKKQDELTQSTKTLKKHEAELKGELEGLRKKLGEGAENSEVFKKKQEELAKAHNKVAEEEGKATEATNDRLKLINEINSKYSTYLGYMLSEASTAETVASAHDLIIAALKEEMYWREQNNAFETVTQQHSENLKSYRESSLAELNGMDVMRQQNIMSEWQAMLSAVTYDAKQGGYVIPGAEKAFQSIEDAMRVMKDRFDMVLSSEGGYYMVNPADKQSRLNDLWGETGAGGWGSWTRWADRGFKDWTRESLEVLKETATLQSMSGSAAQRAHETAIQKAVENTNALIQQAQERGGNVTNRQLAEAVVGIEKNISKYSEIAGRYTQFGADTSLKGIANVLLKDLPAETRKAVENEIQRVAARGTNPEPKSTTTTSPYGTYNRVTDSYDKWDADALVSRRKEMLERVRALANGADVQAVLSEDAKFITEATRNNIKTTRDAIEWYNTERLKIQDALHEKHLTNTGDWMDPTKQKARAKTIKDEWSAYLNELDAYYTERKTRIQEAATEEGITEAEVKNRTLANEMEWHQRRAELQKLYARKSGEVTEEEQQAIFDILSDRTGDTADFIQATIGKTVKFIYDIGKHSEAEMRDIFGKLDKGIERDYLKQQQAVTTQMKAIRDIIEKERPYDGITANLRENLVTMGILTADMTEERNRLMRENADRSDFNSRQATEELKRTAFLLGEAENAYSTTIEEVMRHMGEQGMQAWADAIRGDTQMQQALMAQLRTAYDEIQNAIKKEASLIKKQTDIWWADIEQGQTQSRRDGFEQALSRLGLAEDQVKRANSLIGAGQASERVADKLAIKQMQVRLAMQMTYYNRMRQIGEERIRQLEAAKRYEDAEHLRRSLNLAKTEELKKLEEQRVAIANQLEESQNRLYTELKSWADLLTSSLQSVFEATNTGNAEYYNELAKLNLTGNGGPGAGTYMVIDNEGTSDATAHYEYLDEREALERQHEIERENAQAEAWKKVMDDINMKMSETITDQLNAMLQNASIDANTDALGANTQALLGLTEAITDESGKVLGTGDMGLDENGVPNALRPSMEGENGSVVGGSPTGNGTDYTPEWQQQPHGEQSDWQAPMAPPEVDTEAYTAPWVAYAEASTKATKTMTDNNKKAEKSTKQSFAAMTAAANMYGIAYQAMSNENLSTAQKVEMMIVQAAGQAMISMLTASLAADTAETASHAPSWISKTLKELGPIGGPVAVGVFTALIGGLMGLATSKITKSKSQIAQVTGASSASAGRLSTGMLTYAEGNVNEFTDPSSLTPGKQYNVDAADGRTYRARYMGRNPKTHLTNGPEFHLSGERGREMIIDAGTTRQITMNEGEIWHAIQTLSGGGRISALRRRGRGVAAFADGNIEDFMDGSVSSDSVAGMSGMSAEQMAAFQASLDRNSEIMERIAAEGIKGVFDVYGKGGLVDSYDSGKKTLNRYGQRY